MDDQEAPFLSCEVSVHLLGHLDLIIRPFMSNGPWQFITFSRGDQQCPVSYQAITNWKFKQDDPKLKVGANGTSYASYAFVVCFNGSLCLQSHL